jgi:SAM-dependent methyltransferase
MAQLTGMRDVKRYYDFIYFWSQVVGRFRAFSSVAAYAIHRPLLDLESGEYSDRVIHRLIGQSLAGMAGVDALDAGCGYGGTCLDLCRAVGGRWPGITINKRQHRIAARSAKAMGLEGSASFAVASYDAPLSHSFNVIIGIESLIHSPDPALTVANLASYLRPGGRFIVVDDMLVEPLSPQHLDDITSFKRLWRCPIMPSIPEWQRHLEAAGCAIESIEDLSGFMWPRTEAALAEELAALSSRRWRHLLGLRMVSDAQKGGLLLERLTLAGATRYVMMVARRR